MGLRRITGQQFQISPEEWHKRQMRRHSIVQWIKTIAEIALLIGLVVGMWHLFIWASDQVHP